MLILDDAGQYREERGECWRLVSTGRRFETLWAKMNHAVCLLRETWPEVDAIAVWDDDDLYLPEHLASLARSLARHEWSQYEYVYSNYSQPFGCVLREPAESRFHASWGYSLRAFDAVGGYPETDECINDQVFGESLRDTLGPAGMAAGTHFVLRWHGGNCSGFVNQPDWYHGQSGRLPYRYAGRLSPALDDEARRILSNLGVAC